MRNDESAIGPNGKPTTTPELSPRSVPHNAHSLPGQRVIQAAEPYNPFASAEGVHSEGSMYSPPAGYTAPERVDDGEIKFGNVDWQVKRPEPLRTRTISHLQEVKLDGPPSNQNPPKPAFYRPADSPPNHTKSPPYTATKATIAGEHWYPIDEKVPTGITTPPLTYYSPNKQENFRTNLDDEKHGWDNSRHSSDLQPFPDFEDVELARPNARGFVPRPAPVPMPVVRARAGRSEVCFWIVCLLVFLVPLAIALGVFGGVYHWNIKDERCSMWGGSWHDDSKTCQY